MIWNIIENPATRRATWYRRVGLASDTAPSGAVWASLASSHCCVRSDPATLGPSSFWMLVSEGVTCTSVTVDKVVSSRVSSWSQEWFILRGWDTDYFRPIYPTRVDVLHWEISPVARPRGRARLQWRHHIQRVDTVNLPECPTYIQLQVAYVGRATV